MLYVLPTVSLFLFPICYFSWMLHPCTYHASYRYYRLSHNRLSVMSSGRPGSCWKTRLSIISSLWTLPMLITLCTRELQFGRGGSSKQVTWEPKTYAWVEWEIAPPLPRPRHRCFHILFHDRSEFGRNDIGVKFRINFTPQPFGDLEPSARVENNPPSEQLPEVSTDMRWMSRNKMWGKQRSVRSKRCKIRIQRKVMQG